MKKSFYLGAILIGCIAIFSGCIKNTPYVTTINPSLTANIGTYNFTAATVIPSTVDTQSNDTSKALIITAQTSDVTSPNDRIVLYINDYKGVAGIFSVVRLQAGAYYYHSGIYSYAEGGAGSSGVVSITHVTSNSIIGYFTFTATDGVFVQNGTFNVGKP